MKIFYSLGNKDQESLATEIKNKIQIQDSKAKIEIISCQSDRFVHISPIIVIQSTKNPDVIYPKFNVNLENIDSILIDLKNNNYDKVTSENEQIVAKIKEELAKLNSPVLITENDIEPFANDPQNKGVSASENIYKAVKYSFGYNVKESFITKESLLKLHFGID